MPTGPPAWSTGPAAVRQRLTYPRAQAVLWHVLEPVTFAVERRMLLGIRARVEAAARPRPVVAAS